MNRQPMFACLIAIATVLGSLGMAADLPPAQAARPISTAELDKLSGQPVDLAPWAYAWRADLAVQEKPEAYFIPRRLDRIDKVYRTARSALPPTELKSIYYDMPDLLRPLPPKPKGRLQAGLLWTGGVANYQVELRWPAGIREIPSPDAVEVRVYPTSFGWFGWTVDRIVTHPAVSADRRTWTYKIAPVRKWTPPIAFMSMRRRKWSLFSTKMARNRLPASPRFPASA